MGFGWREWGSGSASCSPWLSLGCSRRSCTESARAIPRRSWASWRCSRSSRSLRVICPHVERRGSIRWWRCDMSRDSLFGARHALRRLVRQHGFSLPVVLTLALGIGATTAVFAVVNGLLIRPLPYRDANRLVALGHFASRVELPMTGLSLGTADYYRAHNRAFEDIGVYVEQVGTLTDHDQPERV